MKQKLTQLFDHLVAQALHPTTPADATCKYAREAAYLASQIGGMLDDETKAPTGSVVIPDCTVASDGNSASAPAENLADYTVNPAAPDSRKFLQKGMHVVESTDMLARKRSGTPWVCLAAFNEKSEAEAYAVTLGKFTRVVSPDSPAYVLAACDAEVERKRRAKEDFAILAIQFAALSEDQQLQTLLRVQCDQQRHALLNVVRPPVRERLKYGLRKLRDTARGTTQDAGDSPQPEVWKQHAIKLWLDKHDEHLLNALTRPSDEKRDDAIRALSVSDREKVLGKLARLQIAVNAAAKAWLPMRPALELLEDLVQQLTEREPFWRAHSDTRVAPTWAHEDAAVVEVLRDCMKASREWSAHGVKLGIPPARKVHQDVPNTSEETTKS